MTEVGGLYIGMSVDLVPRHYVAKTARDIRKQSLTLRSYMLFELHDAAYTSAHRYHAVSVHGCHPAAVRQLMRIQVMVPRPVPLRSALLGLPKP